MKQYVISISDDIKAARLLNFLRDLSYVKVYSSHEAERRAPLKKYPLMENPFCVENFKLYERDELYER